MKIVLVTGGFDPVHSGHLAYFHAAKKLGDKLVVGLNSDPWLARKKGRPFMPISERVALVSALRTVDEVITYNDDDGSSKDAIIHTRQRYPDAEIIFANGGDRTKDNIPEMDLIDSKLTFLFGIGGNNKQNSSSWILEDWKSPKTSRPWGYYRTIYDPDRSFKAKELVVDSGKTLSMQQHQNRAEHWFVADGYATIYTIENSQEILLGVFGKHQSINIPRQGWHRLANETSNQLKLIELQYGTECVEEDIIRKQ
jgi:cytidyltransferase-like protein